MKNSKNRKRRMSIMQVRGQMKEKADAIVINRETTF